MAATEAWRRLSLAWLWKADTQESVTEMEFRIAVAIAVRHSLTAANDSIAAEGKSFEKPGVGGWAAGAGLGGGSIRGVRLSLMAKLPFPICARASMSTYVRPFACTTVVFPASPFT